MNPLLRAALFMGALLAVGAVLFWPAENSPEHTPVQGSTAGQALASDQAAKAAGKAPSQGVALAAAPAGEHEPGHAGHGHDHEYSRTVSAESLDKSHWFEPVAMLDARHFVPSVTALELAESCTELPAFEGVNTLEESLKKQFAIDTSAHSPNNMFFKSITQFFQLPDSYLQMTVLWEMDLPATYRYELFQSTDPRFEAQVSQIPLPQAPPRHKDTLATYQYLQQIQEYYQAQGGVAGARIFEGEINGESEPVSITTVNGKPTFVSSTSLTCRSDVKSSSAQCLCTES
ncbi:hypothetical protein L1F30_02325 [Simiduia sp. 21SJ11W-1]|uniref:hypothetical protein n=1 Tax=Simiduia sp. 21SJ11W-1 TaxID=2909669 RepID=UPI00209E2B32|nr:hypothetical protein [Simiduia sp. 21SJ11W-1]UTA48392.1 hypothetical protein L1F30_02325 [Simiduia sp. 21SJ11W-1]